MGSSLANALRETEVAPTITVEDLEKAQDPNGSDITYRFTWEPQHQKYGDMNVLGGRFGNINGTYYETEEVLIEIQAQLFAEDVNNIKSNIWYRGI